MLRLGTMGLSVVAVAAMAGAVTGCAAHPEPFPVQAARADPPYRGIPYHLALSHDGSHVVVGFRGPADRRIGDGWAILDGRSGAPLFVREAARPTIRSVAVSADGRHVAALRVCTIAPSRGCDGADIVETDTTTATDTVLVPPAGAFYPAYDPDHPRQITTLAFGCEGRDVICSLRRHTIDPERSPGDVIARATWPPAAQIRLDGYQFGPVVFSPGGHARFFVVPSLPRPPGSATLEVTLRPGDPPLIAPLADDLRSYADRRIVSSGDGNVILAAVVEQRGDLQYVDDLLLLRRGDAQPAGHARRFGLAADIHAVALSADGRRGALVATRLQGDDPQPTLTLLDLSEPGAPVAIRTDALARIGLGRTIAQPPIDAAGLLRRLRSILDREQLDDPAVIALSLGLSAMPGEPLQPSGRLTMEGPLAGPMNRPTYVRQAPAAGGADGFVSLGLRLEAAPCLTPENVRRFFGEPSGHDIEPTGFGFPTPRQPRLGMGFVLANGSSAHFFFLRQRCAESVHISQPLPR